MFSSEFKDQPEVIPPHRLRSELSGSENESGHHGFTQTFGLHPATALLTIVVNVMLFGTSGVAALIGVPTAGASLVALTMISSLCGCILGIITYLAQKKWYSDDRDSALIKALIVAFLTAIPVGLPGFLSIPAGFIGLFHKKSSS